MRKNELVKILPHKGKPVYVNYKTLIDDAHILKAFTKDAKATGKSIPRDRISVVYFK